MTISRGCMVLAGPLVVGPLVASPRARGFATSPRWPGISLSSTPDSESSNIISSIASGRYDFNCLRRSIPQYHNMPTIIRRQSTSIIRAVNPTITAV